MSAPKRKRATRGSKNQIILTPAMHGPVGDPTKGYVLNLDCDIFTIQEYLNILIKANFFGPFATRLQMNGIADKNTLQLIQLFQKKTHIFGSEANATRIDPNGLTLERLSEIVHEIKSATEGEIYKGKFNKVAFIAGYRKIAQKGEVGETAVAGLTKLLTYLEEDSQIVDLRWMAYIIATVRRECGVNFSPLQEFGKGQGHKGKTKKNKDNYGREVIVSKQDNYIILDFVSDPTIVLDQSGKEINFIKLTKETSGKPLVTPSTFAVRVDREAKLERAKTGQKEVYFGRGYVQTTWWYNYVWASQRFGLGNSLLFDPDRLVRESDLAYKVLSVGMREGAMTGKKLGDFIHGKTCNYYDARTIVNGHNKALEIKQLAIKIHTLLQQCKLTSQPFLFWA